jgi:N-glycosylase/DNA lyase
MATSMERGAIPLAACPGGVDLRATLESGQSYCWWRADGRTYESDAGSGAWYETVVNGELLRVRETDEALEWEATVDATPLLREALALADDLEAVRATAPADPLVETAYEAYRGLRIVSDPFFPCLISFICSAQMRVDRIFGMQMALRREYGPAISLDGETRYGFPAPETLAGVDEAALRDLNLGYRAPYVKRTAEMVAAGELTRTDAAGRSYEAAREALTGFVGVGEKVADCVCLFSLRYLQAVPLDTWMRRAIEEHYPDCARDSYAETSRAFRERLGGEYAGYTQTYLFHYLRNRDPDPDGE